MAENKVPQYDAGHVPITEEFDSAKRTLPPFAPVAIALVAVAMVVGIIMYAFRAKPVAQGGIDQVFFSQPANMTNAMVLLQVTLRNVGDKTLYIKAINASLKTDQGDLSDDAASPSDYDRYFSAVSGPAPAQHRSTQGRDENCTWRRAERHCAGFIPGHAAAIRCAQGPERHHRRLRSEADRVAREKRADEISGVRVEQA